MKLEGRTILVTGGGSGIGRGLAESLHDRGNRVIVAGRRESALAEVIDGRPGMRSMHLDVSDAANIATVVPMLIREYPELDMLINSAGIGNADDVSTVIDDTLLMDTVATNLVGPVRLTSALIEHLKSKERAEIVHVSSMLAYLPVANMAIYAATKAALHSYILSLRYKLRNTPVAVMEIAPPLVATALTDNYMNSMAMPLDDYIAETMAVLESGVEEVLVERARTRRDGLCPNEIEAMNRFNDLMRVG